MKYKEILEIAEKEKLNITKLFIAYEVAALLSDEIQMVSYDDFEDLCHSVYEYYLSIDYASIKDVAYIVYSAYKNNKSINEKKVRYELEGLYI